MATKKPIYLDKNQLVDEILYNQLQQAINELRRNMYTTIPIKKGNQRIGFGVDKSQRSIAADQVISIAREIKSKPGW